MDDEQEQPEQVPEPQPMSLNDGIREYLASIKDREDRGEIATIILWELIAPRD
jgi:hypothetical protein